MISKLGIVAEECDGIEFWLDMLVSTESLSASRAKPVASESEEILAMVVASIKTLRRESGGTIVRETPSIYDEAEIDWSQVWSSHLKNQLGLAEGFSPTKSKI